MLEGTGLPAHREVTARAGSGSLPMFSPADIKPGPTDPAQCERRCRRSPKVLGSARLERQSTVPGGLWGPDEQRWRVQRGSAEGTSR